MKLTTGVNFINIIRALFSYESRFGSFFSSYMYVITFVRKARAYNVDEIDHRKKNIKFANAIGCSFLPSLSIPISLLLIRIV